MEMAMYAVIKTGGKQYKVAEGEFLKVEKLEGEIGDKIEFAEVLMIGGEKLAIGAPTVAGAMVTAKIAAQGKDKKILVIEQTIPYEFLGKDLYSHAHMFSERMVKYSTNLILDDAGFHAEEEDVEEALRLAKEADLVVMTNYYARIEKRGNNTHLVKALKAAGHTVVVVTNFPYRKGTTTVADAVVCNFSGTPDSIRASVDLLFGAIKPYPTTKMPIDLSAENNLPEEETPAPKKSQEKKPGNVWGGKC